MYFQPASKYDENIDENPNDHVRCRVYKHIEY